MAAAAAFVSLLAGCEEPKHNVYGSAIDPETFATMTTTDVNTLISDSGILRYRLIAPIWLVYDEASDPRWTFPYGMHMERYDDKMKPDATIDCDSAVYFTARDLWRLDGAVDINSTRQERFLTEQLFWDKRERKVYTDSFIHIERPDRIIEGYGLVSNDQFTDYVIIRPTGSFPASQFDRQEQAGPYDPYDPSVMAAGDPADAQRTDHAFNGTPTDTTFVSTQPVGPMPRRRIRPLRLPRNRGDSGEYYDPGHVVPPLVQPTTPVVPPAGMQPATPATPAPRRPMRLRPDSTLRPVKR